MSTLSTGKFVHSFAKLMSVILPVTLLEDLDTDICQDATLCTAQERTSEPDLLTELVKWTQDFLRDDERRRVSTVSAMRYVDAINYFVRKRPPDARVEKGAMLRQTLSQGQIFTQVFLDENGTLVCGSDGKPYGRQLIVRQFDEELCSAFGDQQLIIVE